MEPDDHQPAGSALSAEGAVVGCTHGHRRPSVIFSLDPGPPRRTTRHWPGHSTFRRATCTWWLPMSVGDSGRRARSIPKELMVGWCALHHDRPIRWTETRSESMLGLGHGRAQVQRIRISNTHDGVTHAYRIEVLQDAGACASRFWYCPSLRADTHNDERCLRNPEGRVLECVGRDQHDTDRGLPGDWEARGDLRNRAGGGHVRHRNWRWTRPRSGAET